MPLPLTAVETYEVLDTELELSQLKDICSHGMQAGVAGFIYTSQLISKFDLFEDEIMTYTNERCDELYGKSAIHYLTSHTKWDYDSINDIKSDLVWLYVELTAHHIVSAECPDF